MKVFFSAQFTIIYLKYIFVVFFKLTLLLSMNKEIHCITNEGKRLRMNGKMKTLTFFELYAVYIRS